HWFTRAAQGAHRVTLGLAFVGLAFHQMFDGGALAFFSGSNGPDTILVAGVVLHQVPVGLLVWWVLRRKPILVPALLLLGLGALIVLGYAVQVELGTLVPESVTQAFTALIGGSLLHVLGHDPAAHEEEGVAAPGRRGKRLGALGAVIGLVVLFFAARASQVMEGDQTAGAFIDRLAVISLEAAPALLLAYLIASLLSAVAPGSSSAWLGHGLAWSQPIRGGLVGFSVPLASRSVAPLYRLLVRGGASAAGAMAFLVAGPVLGVDAVLLSFPLLGAELTATRGLAALVVALLVGWFVGGAVGRSGARDSSGHVHSVPPLAARIRTGLTPALGESVDRTAPWILLGMLIAAMLGPDAIARLVMVVPRGVEVAAFGLLGIPIYLSAAAVTPLVAVLVAAGVTPGAGLAFLLTAPVLSSATFRALRELHGRRTALAFGGAVLGLSIGLGLVVNATFPGIQPPHLPAAPADAVTALKVASLVVLVLLVLGSLWRNGIRGFLAELSFGNADGTAAEEHGHAH
ncbi:MAG: permease, partial [Gemmatimonadota bacterium]